MKIFSQLLICYFLIFAFNQACPAQSNCWHEGDFHTYPQTAWGGVYDGPTEPLLLDSYFFTVYPSGILELGIPGTAGYSMWFTDGGFIKSYLPANGAPGPLNADLLDPSTTSSGSFGGEVLSLQLNVDFSDAGLTSGLSDPKLGDFILKDLSALPSLNGLSVRQVLATANELLGVVQEL